MKEVVIGFLGCGNVGGGVWSLLTGFSQSFSSTIEYTYPPALAFLDLTTVSRQQILRLLSKKQILNDAFSQPPRIFLDST